MNTFVSIPSFFGAQASLVPGTAEAGAVDIAEVDAFLVETGFTDLEALSGADRARAILLAGRASDGLIQWKNTECEIRWFGDSSVVVAEALAVLKGRDSFSPSQASVAWGSVTPPAKTTSTGLSAAGRKRSRGPVPAGDAVFGEVRHLARFRGMSDADLKRLAGTKMRAMERELKQIQSEGETFPLLRDRLRSPRKDFPGDAELDALNRVLRERFEASELFRDFDSIQRNYRWARHVYEGWKKNPPPSRSKRPPTPADLQYGAVLKEYQSMGPAILRRTASAEIGMMRDYIRVLNEIASHRASWQEMLQVWKQPPKNRRDRNPRIEALERILKERRDPMADPFSALAARYLRYLALYAEWSKLAGRSEREAMMRVKGSVRYDQLRKMLERKYRGQTVAIEVESGDWFVGRTLSEADEKASARYPRKQFYFHHIGVSVGAFF